MKKTNQPNFNIQRKENNVNNDSGDIFLSSLNELSANDFPKTEKTADPKTKK